VKDWKNKRNEERMVNQVVLGFLLLLLPGVALAAPVHDAMSNSGDQPNVTTPSYTHKGRCVLASCVTYGGASATTPCITDWLPSVGYSRGARFSSRISWPLGAMCRRIPRCVRTRAKTFNFCNRCFTDVRVTEAIQAGETPRL
jgi:hypothetical protein